jgi:RNA polymerase sigma factor (sigma-70 family)
VSDDVPPPHHPELAAARVSSEVRRARAGDEVAFSRLLDAARPSVRAIVLAVLRDPELGHDVEQEVYAAAWLKLSQLRAAERFFHWIRRIARNHAVVALRAQLRERAHRVEEGARLVATWADQAPSVLDRLVAAEEHEALRAAVAALPPTNREAVLLRYRDGRPTPQVAELLDIREDAVRQRLARARAALRRVLGEQRAGARGGA